MNWRTHYTGPGFEYAACGHYRFRFLSREIRRVTCQRCKLTAMYRVDGDIYESRKQGG